MEEGPLLFEEYPDHTLMVLLFKNVNNCGDIRELVIAGTLQPEAAIINAALVPDLFSLQLAAYKALQAAHRQALRTKSRHAEVVFGVSGSKHIAEALTRFGVNESCQHLLVARFDATPEQLQQLRALVAGEEVPLSELPSLANRELINKYYKFGAEELKIGSMGDAIACRIGGRDL